MSPKKILVANRGEIARRIFRTCREQGIATVAVYSDADADALHVAEADEAVLLGEAAPVKSYLAIDKVLGAARRTGADAIHPGYGFLSERPAFAEACAAAGITFIGPSASAMETMGDKVKARRAMIEAGVPVVPGEDDVRDAASAAKVAAKIGFPLMIKAAAGGGGKGMRVVHDPGRVEAAFEAASREATGAFGDGRIFVERAIQRARHVEIQVLADTHGNVVYLGERDCSVQRRHQKVIEECPCPSPQMSPEVRAQMGEVATRVAAAVGYVGAGTVEFLFEETEEGPRFYFLEMNTRLQVEHPVTEEVVGRDLVADQIRVAAGEPLGFAQSDVTLRGHAIECRLYAEDPRTFLPRPGHLDLVHWPSGGGIRVDAAVGSGSDVVAVLRSNDRQARGVGPRSRCRDRPDAPRARGHGAARDRDEPGATPPRARRARLRGGGRGDHAVPRRSPRGDRGAGADRTRARVRARGGGGRPDPRRSPQAAFVRRYHAGAMAQRGALAPITHTKRALIWSGSFGNAPLCRPVDRSVPSSSS